MGLDMYLTTTIHISDDKSLNKIIKEINVSKNLAGPVTITVEIMYWRKANQIHNWFVKNVQNDKDDCNRYLVTRKQLTELFDLGKKVIATRNTNLLPPSEGFFFGSNEVDEYYWENIDYTVDKLNSILNDKSLKDNHFYYQSSW